MALSEGALAELKKSEKGKVARACDQAREGGEAQLGRREHPMTLPTRKRGSSNQRDACDISRGQNLRRVGCRRGEVARCAMGRPEQLREEGVSSAY